MDTSNKVRRHIYHAYLFLNSIFNFISKFYRAAVVMCPSDEVEQNEFMTVEQKQRTFENKQANIRELICKFIFLIYFIYVE